MKVAPKEEKRRDEKEIISIKEEEKEGKEKIGEDLGTDIKEYTGGSSGKEKNENREER